MKPHPGPSIIRKTIKWCKYGGAAVTVLLVVVWIRSMCFESSSSLRALGRDWSIVHGQLHTMSVGGRINVTPIWFLMIVMAFPTAVAWYPDIRARRRAKLNHCLNCGYDRTGLLGGKDAKCPECGAAPVSM